MKPGFEKSAILLVVSLTAFISPFMLSAVNIALPAIQREFGVDAVLLSWIATSYLLSLSIFLLPAGRLSDLYGRIRLFFAGIIVFTAATLGSVFVGSLVEMLLLRVLQGVGAAILLTTGTALLTDFFEPRERGRAFGLNVAAVYTGLSVGPFVGGLLTQHLGWRSIFAVACLPALAVIMMTARFVKEDHGRSSGERLDIPGTLVYAAAISMLLLGTSFLPQLRGALLIAGGLAGFIGFYSLEMRTSQPVFEMRLFTENRPFAFSCLAALINYSATFSVAFLLSLYLQYIKGMSPQLTGSVLIAQPLTQAVLSPTAGKLSDRLEPGIIASIGMAITVLGLAGLVMLDDRTTMVFIILDLVLLGVGFALFSSPNTNAIMSAVPRQYLGNAAASTAIMRTLGQIFSMTVVTVLFSINIGSSEIVPGNFDLFIRSQKTAFGVSVVICSVGIFFSLGRGRIRN